MRSMPLLVGLLSTLTVGLAGCEGPARAQQAAALIARHGFARDPDAIRSVLGQTIALWGFVDHGNLYGDAGAREILAEWWSGSGPAPGTWRFDLKSGTDDAVGHGFAVQVADGPGRDALLRRLVADARANRATRVRVSGRLLTFDAPTNGRRLTGLLMRVQSSDDIVLEAPGP